MNIKTLQRVLKSAGLYSGGIDGILGKNTKNGIKAVQRVLKSLGLYSGGIDGILGKGTNKAIKNYQHKHKLQEVGYLSKETIQLMFKGINNKPPNKFPTERGISKFYGRRGSNQVRFYPPYPMYLAWGSKKKINYFSCHKLIHDNLMAIFTETLAHYGADGVHRLGLDIFGGCLNVRKKRGGNSFSTHSWGIAIDLNPAKNGFRTRRPHALFSRPEYNKFWEIVEKHGATSLGRCCNFDWMHFQFANRRK